MRVRWKNLVMAAMAVLVLFFGRVDCLQAEEVYSEGYFQYTLDETGATIILYYGQEETVVVPEMLGGKPVVAISDDAFSTYGGSVYDLVLPSTIVNTDSAQWKGLNNLENVEIKEEEDVLDLPDATGEASANQEQESPIVSDLVENVDDVEELLEEEQSDEERSNSEEDTSEIIGNSEQETEEEQSKSEENSDSEQGNDIGAETESQSTQSSSSSQEQTEEKVSSKAEVESQSLNSERLNQNVTEENEKNTVVIVMIVIIVIVVAAAIAIWIKRRNHKE